MRDTASRYEGVNDAVMVADAYCAAAVRFPFHAVACIKTWARNALDENHLEMFRAEMFDVKR